jgi:hypothetical protein
MGIWPAKTYNISLYFVDTRASIVLYLGLLVLIAAGRTGHAPLAHHVIEGPHWTVHCHKTHKVNRLKRHGNETDCGLFFIYNFGTAPLHNFKAFAMLASNLR